MNYFHNIPFEIRLIIFEFLNDKSKIMFMSSCKEYRTLIKFCDFDIKTISYKGIQNSAYYDYITHLRVRTLLNKFPKKIKTLVFDETYCIYNFHKYNWEKYWNIKNPCFRYLTRLKICGFFHDICLKNWKLESLIHLNIVNCNNCILDECFFPKLEWLYCNSWYPKQSLKTCKMPLNTNIVSNGELQSIYWIIIKFKFLY